MAEINSYQDLVAWQLSMDLTVAIYEVTRNYPQSELYGLTSQLRRSSASIAANIAEGYGRESTGSYVHFLKTARGSLKELETHIILSKRVNLMSEDQSDALLKAATRVGIVLNALIRSLQTSVAHGPNQF
jgi:four helix bundle protein